MAFESESDFRNWLKINGYTQDVIDDLASRWDSITIVDNQVTDVLNNNEIPNIEN